MEKFFDVVLNYPSISRGVPSDLSPHHKSSLFDFVIASVLSSSSASEQSIDVGGGCLTLWSSCPRSNQSAPSCTCTALPTGLSRPSQWSHSWRGSGERGSR